MLVVCKQLAYNQHLYFSDTFSVLPENWRTSDPDVTRSCGSFRQGFGRNIPDLRDKSLISTYSTGCHGMMQVCVMLFFCRLVLELEEIGSKRQCTGGMLFPIIDGFEFWFVIATLRIFWALQCIKHREHTCVCSHPCFVGRAQYLWARKWNLGRLDSHWSVHVMGMKYVKQSNAYHCIARSFLSALLGGVGVEYAYVGVT